MGRGKQSSKVSNLEGVSKTYITKSSYNSISFEPTSSLPGGHSYKVFWWGDNGNHGLVVLVNWLRRGGSG